MVLNFGYQDPKLFIKGIELNLFAYQLKLFSGYSDFLLLYLHMLSTISPWKRGGLGDNIIPPFSVAIFSPCIWSKNP